MIGNPLVTVIVPTHDHASTLDFAVGSVLAQTVEDVDVVVIGDGVGDDTRAVVRELTADARVRFLDLPKSDSRGEAARHTVINESRAPYICYLGDDDLMLPDHVETMVDLLAHADFAHPCPLMIRPNGTLWPHPIDLQRPDCIDWELSSPTRNAVSLTGASHRTDAYRLLPHGWRTTPAGHQSDHFMWEQWFAVPAFRFATGERLTVLKLESSLRTEMSPLDRRDEIRQWKARSEAPNFPAVLAALIADGWRHWAIQAQIDMARQQDDAQARIHDLEAHQQILQRKARVDAEIIHNIRSEIATLRASVTWRTRERVLQLPGLPSLYSRARQSRRR